MRQRAFVKFPSLSVESRKELLTNAEGNSKCLLSDAAKHLSNSIVNSVDLRVPSLESSDSIA